MSHVKRVLLSAWFWSLIGVLLLAILVWILGPALSIGSSAPLSETLPRLAIASLLLLIWAGFYGVQVRARTKAEQSLSVGLSGGAAAAPDESAVLRQRFTDALAVLKKTTGGRTRNYLYDTPWYVMIGPPGAGKTTAIVHSGLRFPVAELQDGGAGRGLAGIGGTRNCDWWFTDDAVLIDTAGRYTTQDSDASADAGAWKGFLGLLKKHRPRQPINGAVVAIGLADLVQASNAERAQHQAAIRARLAELTNDLGLRVPVYVLFTKADLLAGFIEYFDDLGAREREQVLGFTLPLDDGKGEPVVRLVPGEIDRLIARLNERVVDRLEAERDVGRRSLITAFPSQIASLRDLLADFLDGIFMPSRYLERPLLRGAYFVSGTQTGTPFDRIAQAMTSRFGISPEALPNRSVAGRSYFLARLLTDVVFPEAALVGADAKAEGRRRLVRGLVLGATALVTLAVLGAWGWSYSRNKALIAEVEAAGRTYASEAGALNLQTVSEAAVATSRLSFLSLLDRARALPTGFDQHNAAVPIDMTFGLYQGAATGEAANALYRKLLDDAFRPRLLLLLEQQIRADLDRPEQLYPDLKAYLVLGAAGPLDPALVHDVLAAAWARAYPTAEDRAINARLLAHVDVLMALPLGQAALNGPLVEQARARLSAVPLAARIYYRLKQGPSAAALKPWRLGDKGGPLLDQVFAWTPGGAPSAAIMPGLYTYDGFEQMIHSELPKLTQQAMAESWVLGPGDSLPGNAAATLEQDTLSLYEDDYIQHWDEFLHNLTLRPLTANTEQARQLLSKLAAPNSPLKLITVAIAPETDLGRLVQGADGKLGPADPAHPQAGQWVSDHFRALREQITPVAGGLALVDEVLGGINRVSQSMGESQQGGGTASGAVADLRLIAGRSQVPISTWLTAIVTNSAGAAASATRQNLNDTWRGTVADRCTRASGGRYPFNRDSGNDAPLDDFARVFSPGGLIDGFTSQSLAPYIDKQPNAWRWRAGAGSGLGISDGVLTQLRLANRISEAFFPAGGTLQFGYDVTPLALDPSLREMRLELDGQTINYSGGLARPLQMTWPVPAGGGLATLTLVPADNSPPIVLSARGPWAVFRLFDQGQASGAGNTALKTLRFDAGGHFATLQVQSRSGLNPFFLPDLRSFRCPPAL